jgi:hypothetical protein
MPLPNPWGALPEAHRIVCVRCVRAKKLDGDHKCVYGKQSSKKCSYCTSQNAICEPVGPILTRFGIVLILGRFLGFAVQSSLRW